MSVHTLTIKIGHDTDDAYAEAIAAAHNAINIVPGAEVVSFQFSYGRRHISEAVARLAGVQTYRAAQSMGAYASKKVRAL